MHQLQCSLHLSCSVCLNQTPWALTCNSKTITHQVLKFTSHHLTFTRIYSVSMLFYGCALTHIDVMHQHVSLSGNIIKQRGILVNQFDDIIAMFVRQILLRSKLGYPYFVGIGMSCCPLCCTDLVYSFLPRLSSAPTHLRLVR